MSLLRENQHRSVDPVLDFTARGLAALIAALASSLAYPPRGISAMAFVGLTILLIAVYRASPGKALVLGFFYGLTFSVVTISWFGTEAISYWATSCLIVAGIYSLFAPISAFLSHIPGWPLWTASVFAVLDLVHGIIDISAISVLRMIYTQSDTVAFSVSSIAGPAFVAFAVALISGLFASLIIHVVRADKSIFWLLILSGLASLMMVLIALVPNGTAPNKADSLEVLAVQPSTETGLKMGSTLSSIPGEIGASLQWLRSYASQYPLKGTSPPDLAVLPTRSTTSQALKSAKTAEAIRQTAARLGAPILIGYSTGSTPEFGDSRYSLWGAEGQISDFAVQPHGEGPIEDKFIPANASDGLPLLHILQIGKRNIGIIESSQVFESYDEMPNLAETQYLIVLRPDVDGRGGLITAENLLISSQVLAASTQRPTLTLGERGPSGFSDWQGDLTTWATRSRTGYLVDVQPLGEPGSLPARRDSIVFLLFLIIPIAATVVSLYISRHPNLNSRFSKLSTASNSYRL